MKHYGDITQLNGAELQMVDMITGGSPCQDLSIAGQRKGLAGERSGLFMEQIRIIKEMRDESIRRLQSGRAAFDIRCVQPRYMVWENVPGAFSSNKGEDFRAVLEETAKIADETAVVPGFISGRHWRPSGCIMGSGWSIAWRVHDAQFWGVPQRRKRIALVADFGGQSAPEILFERKGLSGDFEPGEPAQKETTESTGGGAYPAVARSLTARYDGSPCIDRGPEVVVQGNGIDSAGAISFQERGGKPGGGKGILVQTEHTGALSTRNSQMVFDARGNGDGNICPTITGDHENRITDYTAITYQQTTGTLSPGAHPGSYNGQDAYNDMLIAAIDCRNGTENPNINGTLQAKSTGGMGVNFQNVCRCGTVVRRLTPLECTRLQGYPDGWVDIGEWTDSKGKMHKDADSPKYKALGNSIALPFWQWMAQRICNQYDRQVTMGSLFDGIAGFPLVFARCGAVPLWTSEIEEFPIAVCKRHFGDEDAGIEGDIEKYL